LNNQEANLLIFMANEFFSFLIFFIIEKN